MASNGKTYTYKYVVDPGTFRRVLYFNTFERQAFQGYFVAAAWVGAIIACVANVVFKVEMSNVMQMCYIALLLSMPLMVFSCERGWRNYRDSDLAGKERRIAISENWVKIRISGNPESDKLDWSQITQVFELRNMFILYRDADLTFVLPKSVLRDGDELELRAIFIEKLGRSYHVRMRAFTGQGELAAAAAE